jgi:hypothetical protein
MRAATLNAVNTQQRKALATLAAMPPLKSRPHLVSTGLPRASKHDYGNKVTEAQREASTVQQVPIKGLHAVQSGVSPERLRKFIEHPDLIDEPGRTNKGGYLTDVPIVVDFDGKRLVHDGHHRIVASRLLGDKTVPARVVKITPAQLRALRDSKADD